MKTVKEINEMCDEWVDKGRYNTGVSDLFNIVIGITEHLEAAAKPKANNVCPARGFNGSVSWVAKFDECKPLEREVTIKTLRWVLNGFEMPGHHAMAIADAIARITNGGDL